MSTPKNRINGNHVGVQITTNIIAGKKWNEIDEKSVLISAGTGAVGTGLITKVKQIKRLVSMGKTAVTAAETLTDVFVSGAESTLKQLSDSGSVNIRETATDAAFGAIVSGAGQSAKAIIRTNGGEDLKLLERQLDRAERVAGDHPRASRQVKVNEAKSKIDSYGNKEQEKVRIITGFTLEVFGDNHDRQ